MYRLSDFVSPFELYCSVLLLVLTSGGCRRQLAPFFSGRLTVGMGLLHSEEKLPAVELSCESSEVVVAAVALLRGAEVVVGFR